MQFTKRKRICYYKSEFLFFFTTIFDDLVSMIMNRYAQGKITWEVKIKKFKMDLNKFKNFKLVFAKYFFKN